MDYFTKIDHMYEKFENESESQSLEKLLESKIDDAQLENYHEFCLCQVDQKISRMCKAIWLIYLSRGENPEREKIETRLMMSASGVTMLNAF